MTRPSATAGPLRARLFRTPAGARGVAAALLSAALLTPESVLAQTVPEPGEEVRVVQRGARGAVHGLYLEATADEIVLTDLSGGGPIRIPRSQISGMSVQRGERNQAWPGALIGLGVGLAGGVVLAQTTEVFEETGWAVAAGTAGGLAVGLLIGFMIKSPEWDGIDMGALTVRPAFEVRSHRPW